jgi:ABC-type nitrate/sulfonate/bicarbonate transport system permease component
MPYLLGVIILFTAWGVISFTLQNPAIPSLLRIGSSLYDVFVDGELIIHILSTIKLVVSGLLIALFGGVLMAILSYEFRIVEKLFFVPFNSLKNVSAISFFPLLIVLMGISDTARIFIIVWTSFPAIYINMLKGLRSVEKEIIEAAINVGANKFYMMTHILFPLSLRDLFTGIKVGISGGFISLVVSEMLGASRGLGFMILWETNSFKYPNVYAYIIIVALIGLTINVTFDYIIYKLREEV